MTIKQYLLCPANKCHGSFPILVRVVRKFTGFVWLRDRKIVVNGEQVRIFQETAVAYFNVLSFKRRKSHKDLSQDSSWVRDPKTLNLNMTEEKRENEGLVRWGGCSNKYHGSEKSVLDSSPAEGGLCSSETKRDRRKALIPMLFISARELWKQSAEPKSCSGFEF